MHTTYRRRQKRKEEKTIKRKRKNQNCNFLLPKLPVDDRLYRAHTDSGRPGTACQLGVPYFGRYSDNLGLGRSPKKYSKKSRPVLYVKERGIFTKSVTP